MGDYYAESYLEFNKRNSDFSFDTLREYLTDVVYTDDCTKTAVRSIRSSQKKEIYGKSDFWERINGILHFSTAKNTGIFFAGYYADSKKYILDNVSCFKVLAIDIDYRKNSWYRDCSPDYILGMLKEHDFYDLPIPSYAEYGHQLRLLWVLDSPVFLPRKATNPQGRKSVIAMYQRIQTVICDRLNGSADLCAEPQTLNSLIRLPYSFNSKDGSIIQIENLHGKRFDFETFAFEVLPPLPDWYQGWKANRVKKKKKRKPVFTGNDYSVHNERVLKDLYTIQQYYNEIGLVEGYRQNLCWEFFYYSFLVHEGDRAFAVEETLSFNQGFLKPLKPYRLERDLWNCRVGAGLKNLTILRKAGLTLEEGKELKLSIAVRPSLQKTVDRPSYKAKRAKLEKAGKTRQQLYDKRIEKVRKLIASGKSDKEIAEKLGISTRTIRNYKKKL